MLTELRIVDLGVIALARLEPAAGLTVVTGETGAGKTLVVTGLGLIAGARADAGLIRSGRAKAVVEARFTGLPEGVADEVERLGGELEGAEAEAGSRGEAEAGSRGEGAAAAVGSPGGGAEACARGGGELIVVRQLSTQRSRATVAGVGVPTTVATRLGASLVTIHGQSEQVRLGSPARQREVLDRAAGEACADLARRYTTVYEARRRLRAQLDDLREHSQERAREADLLRFGLDEIGRVDPRPGEDVALRQEARRLQEADDWRVEALQAVVALAGDEGGDQDSALSLVARARQAVERLAARDPEARPLAEGAAEVQALLADLAGRLAGYLADCESDPARLEHVTARLAALQSLTRKYGSVADEVIAWAERAAARLADLEGSDDKVAHWEAEVLRLDEELAALADGWSALRRAAADRLQAEVGRELVALALPQARLEFALSDVAELGPAGKDQVNLLFAAHPDSAPQPLGKVASGGELSRVRLALEVVLAGSDEPTTLVFDEVDAGIGGATGVEVGRRLARLARWHQVIVVTHLAQVAAFADRHFVVAKRDDGGVTTTVRLLDEADRPAELARMMGGLADSASAQEAARELRALALAVGGDPAPP